MDMKKLLRELGLNKYEASAYLNILEKGIAEASTIYKEAEIPFGKIYETMSTLANKGLIEVQSTRPKKFKAKKPKFAFDSFFKEKREHVEKDLQRTKEIIMQIEKGVNKIDVNDHEEKSFWTTAVGDEIGELKISNFEEAENEICTLVFHRSGETHKDQLEEHKESIMNEVIKATIRGVKVRALLSKDFADQHLSIFRKFNIPKETIKNIEIRAANEHIPAHFTIIDSEQVVLGVDDPSNPNVILAMTKIWDIKLAKRLKDKFDELWKKAKPIKLM